jgi:predicted aldo/keto reductase-like oxidoreductase
MMPYRELGSTGLSVARIGVGGFAFAITPRKEVERAIHRALDLGLNYFDSARMYGSEGKIGRSLKGRRDRVVLAGKSHFRTPQEVEESLHKSLSELQTDYLDIFHVHDLQSERELEEISAPGGILGLYEELKQQGKIRFIGVSGHDNQALVRALKTGRFDVVYGRYNPLAREVSESVIPLSRRLRRGFVAISALAWGIFSVPAERHPFSLSGKTLPVATTAFRFVLSNPGVDVALAGVRTAEELEELVALLSLPPLTPEESAQVVAQSGDLGKGRGCSQCGLCLPCPAGIDIPLYYRYLTYLKDYEAGEYPALTWQAFARPFSDACTECGLCLERCPFDLPIIEILRTVDRMAREMRHPTYRDEKD